MVHLVDCAWMTASPICPTDHTEYPLNLFLMQSNRFSNARYCLQNTRKNHQIFFFPIENDKAFNLPKFWSTTEANKHVSINWIFLYLLKALLKIYNEIIVKLALVSFYSMLWIIISSTPISTSEKLSNAHSYSIWDTSFGSERFSILMIFSRCGGWLCLPPVNDFTSPFTSTQRARQRSSTFFLE